MKVWFQSFRWLLCVFLGFVAPQMPAQGAKLGIVPQDSELSLPSDLLTVELSTSGGVQLLERADLQRIIKEQRLSAALSENALKLGELSGADGLIVLSLAARSTNPVLNLRLLGVRS